MKTAIKISDPVLNDARLLGAPARDGLRRTWWMIAVDTNVLVYANREDSPFHERARDCLAAALCRQHSLRELWSADRDFGWFPGLHVSNPRVSTLVQ